MKITKQSAENIAHAALKSRKDALDIDEDALMQNITQAVSEGLPEEVKRAVASYPRYFNLTSAGVLFVSGSERIESHERFILNKDLPAMDAAQWGTPIFIIAKAHYDLIYKRRGALVEKRLALSNDIRTLKNAILGLGTYKRVRDQLPELIPFLPADEGQSAALTINLTDVKNILNAKP